jgi:hypothetical protein
MVNGQSDEGKGVCNLWGPGAGSTAFGECSFSAIICVHYPVQRILLDLKAVLKRGGHLFIESFQGHGKNNLQLPKAGEILGALRIGKLWFTTKDPLVRQVSRRS